MGVYIIVRHFAAVAAVVALALGVSACASDPDDALRVTTASTATATITAIDNNFEAQTTTVTAGTTITFENGGRNTHNVVPEGDPKATTWGALDAAFAPKATYSHTFDTPGTYVYYCTIHGTPRAGMFGTIIVTAP